MLWNGNSPYIYIFFSMFLCDLLRAKKPWIMAHQYLQWLQIRVLLSLFSVKSFIWEIWTKKKIQYSILKTLKRMITLWLCIILFMTVHTRARTRARTHLKTALTNKKKSTDPITNHFCLWAAQKAQSFLGCQHATSHHRKTQKWDILHRRHSSIEDLIVACPTFRFSSQLGNRRSCKCTDATRVSPSLQHKIRELGTQEPRLKRDTHTFNFCRV